MESLPDDMCLSFPVTCCRSSAEEVGVEGTSKREGYMCTIDTGFPCGSAGKESACNARDLGSIPGLGRSPGEGKDHPVQYSGLEKAGSDRTEWKNPEAATIVSTQHTNRTGQAMPNR